MIKVLKFGGTSVGSVENMKRVADIVRHEHAKVVVLSAMSGTTDALVKIASFARVGALAPIEELLFSLREKYSQCVNGLLTETRETALEALDAARVAIRSEIDNYRGELSDRAIIAQGEIATSTIFSLYLYEIGAKAELLYAPAFMVKNDDGKVDRSALKQKLDTLVVDADTMYVTQGFIATDSRGGIDNLGRGGSDYSAALIGAALGADEVQIWTDIDGMHNNDPRYVENTYPIHQMSFDEAAELAYFGAKILHPATIMPCKEQGIPVLLKNTMNPLAQGTRISDTDDNRRIFHAVAAKDGITVIRIYSARMLMAYGFLRKVFEIFEQHRTPIDMITTSEVAVSLTIDNDRYLEKIVEELSELGSIEIERDNSIVCVVGRMEHDNAGLAARIFESIKGIPLKMISYGASHRSMAMLISTENKKKTLQSLNDNLFTESNK